MTQRAVPQGIALFSVASGGNGEREIHADGADGCPVGSWQDVVGAAVVRIVDGHTTITWVVTAAGTPTVDRLLIAQVLFEGSECSSHAWIGHSYWLGMVSPRQERPLLLAQNGHSRLGSTAVAGSERPLHVCLASSGWLGVPTPLWDRVFLLARNA